MNNTQNGSLNTTTTIQHEVPVGVCDSDQTNYFQYVDSLICISLWILEHIILTILLKLSPTLRSECIKLLHRVINRCVSGGKDQVESGGVEPMDTSD